MSIQSIHFQAVSMRVDDSRGLPVPLVNIGISSPGAFPISVSARHNTVVLNYHARRTADCPGIADNQSCVLAVSCIARPYTSIVQSAFLVLLSHLVLLLEIDSYVFYLQYLRYTLFDISFVQCKEILPDNC